MTSVVIHPDTAAGQTLRDLIRELADLTPGRPRTTGSGVQVPWDVAQAYLNRKLPQPPTQSTAPAVGAGAAGQAAHGVGSLPGGSGGTPGGEPTPTAKPRKPTPARKTTAAAQQRASRTPRSNP